MADCLLGLVGVTESTDIPFYSELEDSQKEAIALSTSGKYLDTLSGGIDLMGVDDAAYQVAVLDMGIKACKESSKVLSDELLLAINNRFHPAKTKFNGFIGRRTVSATSTSSGNLQGQRYRLRQPIAGIIDVRGVAVCVNGVGNFNVYIARCNAKDKATEEILFTLPVTTETNTWSIANLASATDGIKLPMEIEGIPQEYYFYWNREESGGLFAKNNDLKCGSCGSDQQENALAAYMDYNGVSFTDPNNLKKINTDKHGHGLSITAIVGCDHKTVICREYEKKEAVKLMMDKAAQYKAGELWIEYILKSAWVNRDNLQSREYMWGKRNHFAAEFSKRITAIADDMVELGETNCYTCKENTMLKGTIFS